VIMTSNIGSTIVAEAVELDDTVRIRVLDALRQIFRPEFLNRIDDVVLFSRLDREQLREIVEIQLRSLRARLADRRLALTVDGSALDLLAVEGYDPVYGARPLKRVLQRRVQDPIAMAILEGRFHEGDTVRVTVRDGEVAIVAAQPTAAMGAGTAVSR